MGMRAFAVVAHVVTPHMAALRPPADQFSCMPCGPTRRASPAGAAAGVSKAQQQQQHILVDWLRVRFTRGRIRAGAKELGRGGAWGGRSVLGYAWSCWPGELPTHAHGTCMHACMHVQHACACAAASLP
eukprot:365640-Chlamydomonas_euryale.AAC.6